jgi:hypothetical protein
MRNDLRPVSGAGGSEYHPGVEAGAAPWIGPAPAAARCAPAGSGRKAPLGRKHQQPADHRFSNRRTSCPCFSLATKAMTGPSYRHDRIRICRRIRRAIGMATKHRSGPRSRRRGARDCLGPGATVRRDARLREEEGLKVSAKRPLAHSKRGAGSVCGAGSVYPRLTQSRAFGPTVMIASRPKAWRDPPKEGGRIHPVDATRSCFVLRDRRLVWRVDGVRRGGG